MSGLGVCDFAGGFHASSVSCGDGQVSGQRVLLVRTDAAFDAMHDGPILRLMQPGEATGEPYLLDLAFVPIPESVPAGAVPVMDASAIAVEAGREQVRRMLASRTRSIGHHKISH